MPYVRIVQNWQIQMRDTHTVTLDVREGFFNDTIKLFVDDRQVIEARAGLVGAKGYALFELDGRELELRWVWNMLTGNPASILIMYKDRILAMYGNDRAAEDDVLDGD